MRSSPALFVLLLACVLRHGSAAALSSLNLIPYVAANARFIQENLDGSSWLGNQTVPWIDVDLKLLANGSSCSQDLRALARDLASRQVWALKTMDAWGKLPSGVMQGNTYWTGSPFECTHRLRGLNDSVVEQPFPTRTCTVGNGYYSDLRPVYGMCVPQSCSASELVDYINARAIRIPFIERYVHLTNDSIHCVDRRSFDVPAILTIVLLSGIVFLILLATVVHVAMGHKRRVRVAETIQSGYEPLVAEATVATVVADSALTESVEEQAPPRQAAVSLARSFIDSCSLVSSVRIIKHSSEPDLLACLNGIRVLSMWWVILGHTFIYAAFYSDNVLTLLHWIRQIWFQTIVQAVFSIDSFFLLSGLLTAFIYFISRVENEQFSVWKFLLNHYVYRYLRYTIFYGVMLLVYIGLSPYLARDGPIYPENGTESPACRRTWWRNLLYINNFFDSRDGCVPVTWFLATNMQFHWIAPLFLLAASWKWLLGMLVAIVLIIVDIVSTSVIISKNHYDRGILSDFYANATNTTQNYMNDVYIKPWCRVAPYAIGLLLGHLLHEMHQRANTLSWESILPQRRSARFKRARQIGAWLVALTIFALCVFGTYGDYSGHPLTPAARVTFHALARLGWAMALSIIIIVCFTGHGGLVNKFLSQSFFQLLAKLTFGAYLWHSLILSVVYLGRDQPVHYTLTNQLFHAISFIILSYTFSLFTFLLIEIPVIQLLKQAFQRPAIRAD